MCLQSRGLVSKLEYQGCCRIHVQREYLAAAYELSDWLCAKKAILDIGGLGLLRKCYITCLLRL